MDFGVLGPLEVRDGDREVRLRGGKERALLALLLVNANRTVSLDRIVDDLWGGTCPETAQKMVQIYVSQLRKLLPPQTLHTRPPGYALVLDQEQLDLHRFEQGRGGGANGARRRAGPAGGTTGSARRWRSGAAPRSPSSHRSRSPQPEGARLEELRLSALEGRLDADLALGHHAYSRSASSRRLIAQHPLRERLRSQHMLALYRSGRHAEALAGYQTFRRTLSEELGIEPSASLRELERRMLQQDHSARAAPPRLVPRPRAQSDPSAPPRETTSPTRAAATSESPTRSSATARSTSFSSTAGSAPSSPAGSTRSSPPSTGGSPRSGDSSSSTNAAPASPIASPPSACPTWRRGWTTFARCSTPSARSGRSCSASPREDRCRRSSPPPTRSERRRSILMGTFPREMQAPDYPHGVSEESLRRRLALPRGGRLGVGGDQRLARTRRPGHRARPGRSAWYTSYVRRGASPAATRAMRLMNVEIDIRDLLPTISVPTLVLHRAQESWRDGSRYMGEHIPGAHMVELPGNDHLPWEGDQDALLDEIEHFLAGVHEEAEPDRVLATLLVTDIVELDRRVSRARRPKPATGDRPPPPLRACPDRPLSRPRPRHAATASSRCSTVPHAQSGAPRQSRTESGRAASSPRTGVHTGEVEQAGSGVRGLAVLVAARIAAAARPGEVLVSSTVRDIVAGSGHRIRGAGRTRRWTARPAPGACSPPGSRRRQQPPRPRDRTPDHQRRRRSRRARQLQHRVRVAPAGPSEKREGPPRRRPYACKGMATSDHCVRGPPCA